MGILNITPDSFSDGGAFFNDIDAALQAALNMEHDGATMIDVGGESTRPGAIPISVDEELDRVIPVIEKIRAHSAITISVDSSTPEVMQAAVAAGANFINDVRALQRDGALTMAAQLQVPVCLMHMQGEPSSMQHAPTYRDVVHEVMLFLQSRAATALQAGIAAEHIILDPGFGFGKTLEHNVHLLRALSQLTQLSYPIMVGLSRKAMIDQILKLHPPYLGAAVTDRLAGSLALTAYSVLQGVSILRVHDVRQVVEVVRVLQQILAK